MNTFRQQLLSPINRPRIYPVIHVQDLEQTKQNVERVIKAEADGLFLIHHSQPYTKFAPLATQIIAQYPEIGIGVNFLDLHVKDALQTGKQIGAQAVWTDNLGVDLEQSHIQNALEEQNPVLFGAVAFKYQAQPADLQLACQNATQLCDVVCTSGPGTGHAADTNKLKTMKQALGNHPLATASGITPQNILGVKEHLDAVLVATGVSHGDFHHLDTELIKELIKNSRK